MTNQNDAFLRFNSDFLKIFGKGWGPQVNEPYVCAECNEIYWKRINDDECKEQFKKEFPNTPFNDDCVLVCDDCYQKLRQREKEYKLKL